MNKPRKKRPVRRDRPQPTAVAKRPQSKQPAEKPKSWRESRNLRETIESLVFAVVLALLLRTYEGEPFVIPTGSMAPTLMGRHIRLDCDQCGFHYASGASAENADRGAQGGLVIETTCPNCRFPQQLRRAGHPEATRSHESISGDRIIVNKFAYLLSDPQRWDVIVFRYPHDAKRNYIKRLIGLPTETIRIFRGDIYFREPGESEFRIARKPPDKLRAMLQLVHDSDYLGQQLFDTKWPSRWQQWAKPEADRAWQLDRKPRDQSYRIQASGDETHWLRYRHLPPQTISIEVTETGQLDAQSDWYPLDLGRLPADVHQRQGELITDFYPYNASAVSARDYEQNMLEEGLHWVGDLGMECDVEIQSDTGELSFDLVEGGIHFTCAIDIQTGVATLSIQGGDAQFADEQGTARETVQGQTAVEGAGSYQIRFANVDDELTLWVNERVVPFEIPATYRRAEEVVPHWSAEDPGDAEPLGVGSRGADLVIHRLRVLRDVYYTTYQDAELAGVVEANGERFVQTSPQRLLLDYPLPAGGPIQSPEFVRFVIGIREVLRKPERWQTSGLFDSLNELTFELKEGQLFPLGDNSPGSQDARIWGDPERQDDKFVSEELLMGKAAVIYFPHSPVFSFWPDFKRFGFIR